MTGEVNKAINTFSRPLIWIACQPAPATTAPMKPPINACEELLGKPRYQVRRFHKIAASRAARMTAS